MSNQLEDIEPPIVHTCDIPEDVQNLFSEASDELCPWLSQLILLEPDQGHLYSFRGDKADFTLWSKHKSLEGQIVDMTPSLTPIQNQGRHQTCYSHAITDNITEARFRHNIDDELTFFSYQYLVDFANPEGAKNRYESTEGNHYCAGCGCLTAMVFSMVHGLPKRVDWTDTGCGKEIPTMREVKRHHLLNDARAFKDLDTAIQYLKIQPILANIYVFGPEFKRVGGGVYRGPASSKSLFRGLHLIGIFGVKEVNGETVLIGKNSHGEEHGVRGMFTMSYDVMMLETKTTDESMISREIPGRLVEMFFYGEVRKEFERKVDDYHIEGHDKSHQIISTDYMSLVILEGICHNTSGNVFQFEDGRTEVIGSPTNRALLKWALESDMDFTSVKSGSTVMKRSITDSTPECLGTLVKSQSEGRDVYRLHWKGNAAFILDKCCYYESDKGSCKMTESKVAAFRHTIDEMVAKDLSCVAIAFTKFECNDAQLEEWILPSDNLILLAIFGIKNPCPPCPKGEFQGLGNFEDEIRVEFGKKSLFGQTAETMNNDCER